MCASRGAFVDYRVDHSNRTVSVAKSGVTLRVLGVGTVVLDLNFYPTIQSVVQPTGLVCARLENTLHVENLSRNLFSIPAILAKAKHISMDINGCEIYRNGKVVGSGTKRGNLIYLNVANDAECHVASEVGDLWHRRFGHASHDSVAKVLAKNKICTGSISNKLCNVCELSKQARKPYPTHDTGVNVRSDIVCSDVLRPISPASRSGCAYAVTFIMMKTRFVKVYPVVRKSDVLSKFIEFRQYMKTQAGVSVRTIRSENGGEYTSTDMKTYCALKTVKQKFMIPHNPPQNGMAERANRTLVEMARCMQKDRDMEKTLWAEALVTAAYIRNTISTATRTHNTPFEETFNRLFACGSLRVFGTECFAHVPKTKRSKLDDSGVRCRMLGYLENQKGYRLLNASTGHIMHSRSVTIDESAREKVKPETDEDVESDGHETKLTDTKFHGSVDANLNDNGARGMASEHQIVHCNYPQTHQLQVVDPRGSESLPGSTSIQPHGNAEVQVQGHHQLNGCTDIVLTDLEESMSPRMTGRQMIISKPSDTPDRDGLNQRRVRPARKRRGILRYEDEFNGMRRMDSNEADLEDEFDGLHCYSTALNNEKKTTYDGIMQSELKVQ
uniref:Integrase catalytic domain-containing protein n=1 Tax=Peronospora matthiolae TaxID=2874970 RepID=A0AAV1TD78_9STRA